MKSKVHYPSLILLNGRAGTGKDLIGGLIQDILQYEDYHFAKPLKSAVNGIFGWDEEHSNGALKEVVDPYWGVSPRYAYQTLGTEWGRNLINQDIWLKCADRAYDQASNGLVIKDCRFDNEANWGRSIGGVIITIISDRGVLPDSNHPSEAGITFNRNDYQIINNKDTTIEDLKAQVWKFLEYNEL